MGVVQCPFHPITGGGFRGKSRFGALETAGLRGGGRIGRGIAPNDCYGNFPILHESPAVQSLIAALLTESVHRTNSLLTSLTVYTWAHAAVQAERTAHLCFNVG